MCDGWCIENDFAAQRELAAEQEARIKSAEVDHIQQLTSALKCCLGLLNRHAPEITANSTMCAHSMDLIKRSNLF